MKYDGLRFDPPAPLAFVELRDSESARIESNVPMLIDSGADVTLVPRFAVDALGSRVDTETTRELMSFDGSTSVAHVVRLELFFQGRIFRGQFLITNDDVGVLGRNLLNKIALVLHGPRQEWYELKS